MYFIDHVAKGRGSYTRVGAKTEHFILSTRFSRREKRGRATLVDHANILTNNDPLYAVPTGKGAKILASIAPVLSRTQSYSSPALAAMDARWGSLFPSLTFSATLSSMHHIVYITVRMTKFSSDVGTYASFGSMYICTETRIRSSHSRVPSPPAVSTSSAERTESESNEALPGAEVPPVDSPADSVSTPAPLAVPNHDNAALAASLFASHPSARG